MLVTGGLDPLWEATVAAGADRVGASNVIANRLVGAGIDPCAVDATELAELVDARERIPRGVRRGDRPHRRAGVLRRSRTSRRRRCLTPPRSGRSSTLLAANPAQVERYRAGKEGLLGFFVGQVMKETKGQADARAVNELIRAKLSS